MNRPTPSPKSYRILILVYTNWDYGREIVQGARHYAFATNRMQVGNIKFTEDVPIAEIVAQQKIDGIIAAVHDRKWEQKLAVLPIPVVSISNVLNPTCLPLATQEERDVGRLAADHLLSCGCTTLAYWGQTGARFSEQRIAGFLEEVRRRNPALRCVGGQGRSLLEDEGEPLLAQMRGWMKKLPPKTGIFAVLDPFALHLLQVAREIGKRVPQDIAIMGVGDDCFWVNFENVPLSSVKLPVWQIGFAAAQLLDELIGKHPTAAGGRNAPGGSLARVPPPMACAFREEVLADAHMPGPPVARYLPVREVAARQSTDVLFVDDLALSKAIAYIRGNAGRSIYVPDVVRASGISRSGLQRRFAQFLKRSILDEIQNARIERIKTLLRTSDMKITEIAESCDFPNTPRLHVLFHAHTGQTPGQYRRMHQKR